MRYDIYIYVIRQLKVKERGADGRELECAGRDSENPREVKDMDCDHCVLCLTF